MQKIVFTILALLGLLLGVLWSVVSAFIGFIGNVETLTNPDGVLAKLIAIALRPEVGYQIAPWVLMIVNTAVLVSLRWPGLFEFVRRRLPWVSPVTFTYKNKSPWIEFVDVPPDPTHRIAVKVIPFERLSNATGHLKAIRMWDGKDEEYGPPMNQGTNAQLGWCYPNGAAWEKRTITTGGELLIVFACDADGRTLHLFTNEKAKYVAPLNDAIQPGKYELAVC